MNQHDCLISQHNLCRRDDCCNNNPDECSTTCDPCFDQCNSKCNNIYGLTLPTGNCEFGCYVSCFEAKGRVFDWLFLNLLLKYWKYCCKKTLIRWYKYLFETCWSLLRLYWKWSYLLVRRLQPHWWLLYIFSVWLHRWSNSCYNASS